VTRSVQIFAFYPFCFRRNLQTTHRFEMKLGGFIYDHVRKVLKPGRPTSTEWIAPGYFSKIVFRFFLNEFVIYLVFTITWVLLVGMFWNLGECLFTSRRWVWMLGKHRFQCGLLPAPYRHLNMKYRILNEFEFAISFDSLRGMIWNFGELLVTPFRLYWMLGHPRLTCGFLPAPYHPFYVLKTYFKRIYFRDCFHFAL